jgi:hypothetical protein
MATVVIAFLGVPDGEVIPRQFEPGDNVDGDLGAVAVREGWAEEEESSSEGGEQKAAKPAENKARKAAPENK